MLLGVSYPYIHDKNDLKNRKKNRNYYLFWNFNILVLTTQNLCRFNASVPGNWGEKSPLHTSHK
jgi:hypothetical protein